MSAAEALPKFDIRTSQALAVAASREVALAAARSVTVRETPLVRLLFRLRGLRTTGDRPLWQEMSAEGFVPFDEETLVAIGRPWSFRGDLRHEADFAAFAEPGWAKLALDFRYEGGRLLTETRVLLTDDHARRAFRRYWLVIRPFSSLVRRSWLRAARRRAEAAA